MMKWAARDARSLGNRVLLLVPPTRFVVDATQLDMDGSCAYFIFRCGLFRYNFIGGEAKLMKLLRHTNKTCVWLLPPPVMSSIQSKKSAKGWRLQRRSKQFVLKVNIVFIFENNKMIQRL